MNTPVTFTPAGSVTVQTPCSPSASSYAMPAVDANNVDLQVVADAGTTACVAFGPGAVAGLDASGSVVVKPGQAALLTAQAALLARGGNALANVNLPGGRYTAATFTPLIAGAAAAATVCSVVTVPAGGSVTITRGTAAASTQF